MKRLVMRFAAGIGALSLAGTMTACVPRPNTAATVGTDRITIGQINEVIDNLPQELRTQTVVGNPSVILNIEMRALAAQQVAAEVGVDDLRAQATQRLADLPVPAELLSDDTVRDLLVAQEEIEALKEHMGTRAMEEAFADIPVTVNPRYGMTGLEELQALRNTSLSKPAGAPE